MGRFEDILKAAMRQGEAAEEAASLPGMWSSVFYPNGSLVPGFSAEAVAEMLQNPAAAARLAELPDDVLAELRAGLADQNRLWAEKFDDVLLDARTSPTGEPAPATVLPRVYEGGASSDDIAGLGFEDMPSNPEELTAPPRQTGNARVGKPGVDSKGYPRTAPARQQGDAAFEVAPPAEDRVPFNRIDGNVLEQARKGSVPDRRLSGGLRVVLDDLRKSGAINPETGAKYTMDELVMLPKEQIDALVRGVPEGGAVGRRTQRNPEGQNFQFDQGGASQRFRDPATGKSRTGQKQEPAMKSTADRQHELARTAAGTDPSAPTRVVSEDQAGEAAAFMSNSELPTTSQRVTQPPAARAGAAVSALMKTFREHAPSIMKGIAEADDTAAAELAYGAAADIVNRMFRNTERVSPRAGRDAIHGVAAALLSSAGRRIDVLPDSVVEADIAAIRATDEAFTPRLEDQMAGMEMDEYVSRARAGGVDPEEARLQWQRNNRRRGWQGRGEPVETAPLDLSPEVRELYDGALAEAGFNDPTNPLIRSPNEREYTLEKPYPVEPAPGKYPAGPKRTMDAPEAEEPRPRGPGRVGAPDPLPELPPITDNPPRPTAFDPNGRIDATLPAGAADELDDLPIDTPAVPPEAGALADVPAAPIEVPAKPKGGRGRKGAASAADTTPAAAGGQAAEEMLDGVTRSEWRRFYTDADKSTPVVMDDAEFDRFWEGQRARGRVQGSAAPAGDSAAAATPADPVPTDAVPPADPAAAASPRGKRSRGRAKPATPSQPAAPAQPAPAAPTPAAPAPAQAAGGAYVPPWQRPPVHNVGPNGAVQPHHTPTPTPTPTPGAYVPPWQRPPVNNVGPNGGVAPHGPANHTLPPSAAASPSAPTPATPKSQARQWGEYFRNNPQRARDIAAGGLAVGLGASLLRGRGPAPTPDAYWLPTDHTEDGPSPARVDPADRAGPGGAGGAGAGGRDVPVDMMEYMHFKARQNAQRMSKAGQTHHNVSAYWSPLYE